MTNAADTTATDRRATVSKEDRALRNKMASVMYFIDTGKENIPADAEERRAEYAKVREDYVRKAGKLMSALRKRGITIEVDPAQVKTQGDTD